MNTILHGCTVPAVLLLMVTSGAAQQAMMHVDTVRTIMTADGDMFRIGEAGALIGPGARGPVVQHVMTIQTRSGDTLGVDLRKDDVILMANGKRVRTVPDLRRVYDSTRVGAAFRLGLERDGEMRMTEVRKRDAASLPTERMMVIRKGGGEDEDVGAFPALGAIIARRNAGVVIDKLIPFGSPALAGRDAQEGDIIVSLNGTRIASVPQFSKQWDGIRTGDTVRLVTRRAGKTITLSFPKPVAQQTIITK